MYESLCEIIRNVRAQNLRWPHKGGSRARIGYLGEQASSRYLADQGYHVWKVNWRCRLGEVDIIAYKGNELAVIEVKTSTCKDPSWFDPLDKVDYNKERRLRKLAQKFMYNHRVELKARRLWGIRIDTIRVVLRGMFQPPQIEHFQGSVPFEASEG